MGWINLATKLMVYLAKTLCTRCTDAFAKFNGKIFFIFFSNYIFLGDEHS
jgi:hypothetical protein